MRAREFVREVGPYQSSKDFAASHPSPSVMDEPTRADQERAQAIEPMYPETWIAPELRSAGAAVRGMAGRRKYDPVDIVDRITPDIMKPTKPFQGPAPEIGANLKKYPSVTLSPAERAAKRAEYVGRETAEKGKQELERLGSFIVNPYDTVVPPHQTKEKSNGQTKNDLKQTGTYQSGEKNQPRRPQTKN